MMLLLFPSSPPLSATYRSSVLRNYRIVGEKRTQTPTRLSGFEIGCDLFWQYHSEAWVNLNDITLMVIALGLERLAPAAVKVKLYEDDKVLKKG